MFRCDLEDLNKEVTDLNNGFRQLMKQLNVAQRKTKQIFENFISVSYFYVTFVIVFEHQ